MRNWLIGGVALAVLAGCGSGGKPDPKAQAALTEMALADSGSGQFSWDKKTVAGKTATFRDVTIQMKGIEEANANVDSDGTDGDVSLKVGGRFNTLQAKEMVLAGLGTGADGQPVFTSFKLKGVSGRAGENEANSGTFALADFELLKPSPALAAWVANLIETGEAGEPPVPENVSFEKLVWNGLSFAGGEDGSTGSVAVKRFAVNDVADLLAGSMALDGLKLTFDDAEEDISGTFDIASIKMDNLKLDFASMMEEADGEAQAQAFADRLSNPLDPGFDRFSMDGVRFDAAGLTISAPKTLYTIKRNSDGVPTRLELNNFDLAMIADADKGKLGAQVSPILTTLDLKEVRLKAGGATLYDPKTDIATSEESFLELVNAFRLESNGKVSGYKAFGEALTEMQAGMTPEQQQEDVSAVMAEVADAYSKLSIHNLSIVLEDTGLIERAIAFQAKQSGQEPEAVRSQAVAMVAMAPMMASGAGIDQALVTDLVAALSTFIAESGTLTIAMAPETPLNLGTAMEAPQTLTKDRLGFSATAE